MDIAISSTLFSDGSTSEFCTSSAKKSFAWLYSSFLIHPAVIDAHTAESGVYNITNQRVAKLMDEGMDKIRSHLFIKAFAPSLLKLVHRVLPYCAQQ